MFARTFIPWQLLRHVYGTEPFVQYCQSRSLAFEQRPGLAMERDDFARWQAVLKGLPEAEQAKVELELAQVNEMAHMDTVAQLLAAARERGLPSDLVPGETALALWFLLHYPELFQEVFFQHEVGEIGAWRTIRVPRDTAVPDFSVRKEALANSLKECLKLQEGTGRFCVVDVHPLQGSYCFIAYLSDRLQLFDVFTEEGKHTTRDGASGVSHPVRVLPRRRAGAAQGPATRDGHRPRPVPVFRPGRPRRGDRRRGARPGLPAGRVQAEVRPAAGRRRHGDGAGEGPPPGLL